MGLTHYWQRQTEFDPSAFGRAIADCRKIISVTQIPVAGFNGSGQPILSDEAIVFNGAGGAAFEPFEIHRVEFDRRGRQVFWGHCKTGGAPYDLCVRACLIVFKHHFGGEIRVCSDAANDDWADARHVCQECLGYGKKFQLDSQAD